MIQFSIRLWMCQLMKQRHIPIVQVGAMPVEVPQAHINSVVNVPVAWQSQVPSIHSVAQRGMEALCIQYIDSVADVPVAPFLPPEPSPSLSATVPQIQYIDSVAYVPVAPFSLPAPLPASPRAVSPATRTCHHSQAGAPCLGVAWLITKSNL